MIQAHKPTALLAALVAAIALTSAGCNRTSTDTAGRTTTDKMASTTDRTASTTSSAPSASSAMKETAAPVDDAAITTKVKTAVLAEPGLKSLQIDVDTKDAVVTLSGTVDTPELKSRAVQIAQSVQGVKSVNDNLSVKTG